MRRSDVHETWRPQVARPARVNGTCVAGRALLRKRTEASDGTGRDVTAKNVHLPNTGGAGSKVEAKLLQL